MFRNTNFLSIEDNQLAVEPDNSPSRLLIVMLSLLTIVLFAVGYAVKESLQIFFVGRQSSVDFTVTNPELAELKTKSEADLSGYAELDGAKGVFKIPVDRAMEMLVRKQSVNFK